MLLETRLEGFYGYLSYQEIENARNNAFVAGITGVSEGMCPVENVVGQFTDERFCQEDYTVEVGVDSEQAEFYVDESQTSITVPVTEALNDWMCAYARGEKVKEGVIYIGRDDTLEDQPLFLGIDYLLSAWNLTDFGNLDGMERRITRKHIDDSMRGDCRHCPVAMVLSEMFPHYEVYVDGDSAIIHTAGNEHVALNISEQLATWVDKYDNENEVGTFTVIINSIDDDHYELGIRELSDREIVLQKQLERLSELSAEMEKFYAENELFNKLTDDGEDALNALMQEYQDLFGDTVYEYGR